MPLHLDEEIQNSLWRLASALASALEAPNTNTGAEADPRWEVSAVTETEWSVSHPDLPIVRDDEGATKDDLLSLKIKQNGNEWLVVAQNNVLGTDANSYPLTLVVAKENDPPNKKWPFDDIARAASNWFVEQLQDLKSKAQGMTPDAPPGSFGQQSPQPEEPLGLGFPTASRKAQVRAKVATSLLR